MNRHTFHIGLALLALVVFGLAGPLPAASAANLQLEGTATVTQSQGNRVSGTAVGSGTPVGNFTGTFSQRTTGNTTTNGMLTIVANGGSINITYSARFNPKTGTNQGTFQIVGGTGQFAGATGSGIFVTFGGGRFTVLGVIN